MNILILTATFPFLPGEYFFEDEISLWGQTELFEKITLAPFSAVGIPRATPSNVRVDTSLAEKKGTSKFVRLLYCVQALFHGFFYKEIAYLAGRKKLNYRTFRALMVTLSGSLIAFERLKKYLKNNTVHCIYSYWNDIHSYGAVMAKKEGLVDCVVTRAHGFDVYEERRPQNYMPLKRQFVKYFDAVFVLAESARTYMAASYGVPPELLKVAPLGVPLPEETSTPAMSGPVKIASVSSCRPIKRIDRIIRAIVAYAPLNPQIKIHWDHIGDGLLMAELEGMAGALLPSQANVTFCFHGFMENKDVKAFHWRNCVDVFINASESEGIPVSVMEAMAAGVIPVAPDVGGVSDLVKGDFGVLMSKNPTIEEIASALDEGVKKSRDGRLRDLARKHVKNRFHSEKNYVEFINTIHRIVSTKS